MSQCVGIVVVFPAPFSWQCENELENESSVESTDISTFFAFCHFLIYLWNTHTYTRPVAPLYIHICIGISSLFLPLIAVEVRVAVLLELMDIVAIRFAKGTHISVDSRKE